MVTFATAKAFGARANAPEQTPPVLSRVAEILTAVADRLIPQNPTTIDLGVQLRWRLTHGTGDGWRYAELPDDAQLFERGLAAIEAATQAMFGASFVESKPEQQDEVLRAVQFGRVTGPEWRGITPQRFFVELLAALVDLYYAQPVALDDIGYAGFADARGWQDVSIGARAEHEPEIEA